MRRRSSSAWPKQRGIENVLLLSGAKLMLIKQPLDVGLLDHLVLNINVPLILKSSFFLFFFFISSYNFLGSFWREGELGDNCFAGSCDTTWVTHPCFGRGGEAWWSCWSSPCLKRLHDFCMGSASFGTCVFQTSVWMSGFMYTFIYRSGRSGCLACLWCRQDGLDLNRFSPYPGKSWRTRKDHPAAEYGPQATGATVLHGNNTACLNASWS